MEISHLIYHSQNYCFESGRKKKKDCLGLQKKLQNETKKTFY